MESWLHALTYLRNLCAHHTKLWDRSFSIRPCIATGYKAYLKNNSRFCAQAAIINVFLDVISPESNWSQNLYSLMVDHPEIHVGRMGFSKDWYVDPFWGG